MGGDCRGIQRESAQDIVRTVVAPGFVDRQNLDGADVVSGGPLDHLRESFGIANAEIMPSAQREEGNKQPCDFFLGIEMHFIGRAVSSLRERLNPGFPPCKGDYFPAWRLRPERGMLDAMKITYYGHACFSVLVGKKTLLFDPFITPNPLASSVDVSSLRPDYILLSHGHSDHVADVEKIAIQSGATLIGNFEVIQWFASKGLTNSHPMNSGGGWNFDFGRVTFTPAIHSSSMPDGSYGGQPGGFLVETPQGSFYYSGDTALTRDIELMASSLKSGPLKFAALCIGDNFTMGVKDAITAADWLGCTKILGVHYDTFPPIVIDHDAAREAFAKQGKTLHLPTPGSVFDF